MGRAATPKTNCALLRAFATCTHPRPLANRSIGESYWKDAVITVPLFVSKGRQPSIRPSAGSLAGTGTHTNTHTHKASEKLKAAAREWIFSCVRVNGADEIYFERACFARCKFHGPCLRRRETSEKFWNARRTSIGVGWRGNAHPDAHFGTHPPPPVSLLAICAQGGQEKVNPAGACGRICISLMRRSQDRDDLFCEQLDWRRSSRGQQN